MTGHDRHPASSGKFPWDFKLARLIYTGVLGVGSSTYHRLQRLRGRIPPGAVDQRCGRSGPPGGDSPVWVHASSMGEVRVASGMIARLVEVSPESNFVCSVSTETGFKLAGSIMPGRTAVVRAPIDSPRPIRSFIERYRPRASVLIETEWWPNQLQECHRNRIPVFVVNGRVSATSAKRYGWVRRYMRPLLNQIERFYMRSAADAERLISLGVDRARVEIAGSLKNIADPDHLVNRTTLPPGPPVFLAGCTRPGEEIIVLDAFRACLVDIPHLRLWLAPRHPERFGEVAKLIKQTEFSWAAFSVFPLKRLNTGDAPTVLLIDKMGVLAELYERAHVAFIGGSLLPFGGHNPVEPILAGAPVLFGPHTEEQADAANALEQADLGVRVFDARSLADAVLAAIQNPPDLTEWNRRRQSFFAGFNGAARRVAEDILERMNVLSERASTATEDADGPPLG